MFVQDNGVCFDPRYTNRLFGIFQRLHRQEKFEGAGAGWRTCAGSSRGKAVG